MDKKSTRILLSILHICILGVCILTIYNNKHSGVTVANVSFDTKTAVTPRETVLEPETSEEPEEETKPEGEVPAEEVKPESEVSAEEPEIEMPAAEEEQPEAEDAPRYSFRYIGKRSKLNMRSAPSMDAEIIGKVPVGGGGSVLELTDEEWVRAEYNGSVGYCSRAWIELEEITE